MYRFYSTVSFIWILTGIGARVAVLLGFILVFAKIISLLWN